MAVEFSECMYFFIYLFVYNAVYNINFDGATVNAGVHDINFDAAIVDAAVYDVNFDGDTYTPHNQMTNWQHIINSCNCI